MKTKLFITILITLWMIGGTLSFWCGIQYGKTKSTNCRELKNQIAILETYNSSQAWYLADEKRKNAAFQEHIEDMER